MSDPSNPLPRASRRGFLRSGAVGTASIGLLAKGAQAQPGSSPATRGSDADVAAGAHPTIKLTVNAGGA